MTPPEVAAFLRKYNVWRRGNLDDLPMPDPRDIGEAIDAAVEMIDRLEAAEKDVALKERVIDAIGTELNVVLRERDALRAKVEQMEKQEPVAIVEDDHNANGLGARISEYLPAGTMLYALPGAKGEEK